MKPVLLSTNLAFPDPRQVVCNDQGLIAIGGDLSVPRLRLAYESGIFPWTDDPITWWSPDPRGIFELDTFHVPRSLGKVVRRCRLVPPGERPFGTAPAFDVTMDRAFREVITACAAVRGSASWIAPSFIEGYTELHRAGFAHSVECWQGGQLAGGIYGVAIGGLFAGESMFHRVSNASKVALAFLVEHLRQRGFTLFDIQMVTETTEQFGAINISRDEYLERLRGAVQQPMRF